MNGGSIEDNTATYGGGIYNGDALTMNSGQIVDNQVYSGGIYNSDIGTVTINDGSITDNTAEDGGGVFYTNDSTFFILFGSVTGNHPNDQSHP